MDDPDSSICTLSNLESIPWSGMLATIPPSLVMEIPVATSGGLEL